MGRTESGAPLTGTGTLAGAIERRLDTNIIESINLSAQRGMAINSMGQALEIAKLMSLSGCAVPRHLRNNPGACLAVAIQGYEWSVNPFAIANKSYEVNDRLGYESALYHAVVLRRAPIKGRVKMSYSGEGLTLQCKVWATLIENDEIVDYESPKLEKINPRNSPLWKSDERQQIFYYSVRAFTRRHFPDVMMGVYTVDELQDDAIVAQSSAQPTTMADRLRATAAKAITSRPVSENQTFVPDAAAPGAQAEDAGQSLATPPITAQETHEVPQTATKPVPVQSPSPQTRTADAPAVAQPTPEADQDAAFTANGEIDVTGADAEPPASRRAVTIPPHEPLLSHEKLMSAMENLAQDEGAIPSELSAFMTEHQAKAGFKSWTKLAPKEREAILVALGEWIAAKPS